MDIDIVFLKQDETPVLNGKTFTVQMDLLPRIGECVLFDYSKKHESHEEFYSVIEKELKKNMFTVVNLTHTCAVLGKSHGLPTLFLKPV